MQYFSGFCFPEYSRNYGLLMCLHESAFKKLSFDMSHAIFQFFRFFPFSVFSGHSGNGNPDFLVPLESLGQAQSAGTLQMSVGAPVEPQLGKTGKPVFRL